MNSMSGLSMSKDNDVQDKRCREVSYQCCNWHYNNYTIIIIIHINESLRIVLHVLKVHGWCLSNREDALVLEQFFRAMKQKTGPITPKWFMSDDAEQFLTGWISAFGPVQHKLLCTWHVDRAWRQKIQSLVKNKETQCAVYRNLRLLMEEQNEHNFEDLLQKTIQQFQVHTDISDFAQYFQNIYVHRKHQWAYCYRKMSTINTNMYVEAFHHILKYMYLQGKVNRRVDKCVHILMKIARDKSFERLTKLHKGKNTSRHVHINRSHKASLTMETQSVSICEENDGTCIWNVKSEDGKREYKVTEAQTQCKGDCFLKCTECNICIHSYECTCPDNFVLANICKHIHLTVQHKEQLQKKDGLGQISSGMATSETEMILANAIECNTLEGTSRLEEQVIHKLQTVRTVVSNCKNKQLLHTINSQLTTIIHLAKTHQTADEPTLPPAKKFAPNKAVTPQRKPFFSTRKKKKTCTIRLSKPTLKEKDEIHTKLKSNKLVYNDQKQVASGKFFF